MKGLSILLLATGLSVASCNPQPQPAAADGPAVAEQAAGDEASLTAADADLQQAVAEKDLDGIMAHYADDAVLLPAATPMISGKQAITEEWKHILAIPQLENTSKLIKAEASAEEDLGYTMGSYQSRMTGEDGSTVTEPGKWLSIWRKQDDGSWQIIVETYNTDVPPPDHK